MMRSLIAMLLLITVASSMNLPNISDRFTMRINMTRKSGQIIGWEDVALDIDTFQLHISVKSFVNPNSSIWGQLTQTFDPPSATTVTNSYLTQYVDHPWSCQNNSISEQWTSSFWAFPNASYSGITTIANKRCNYWTSPIDPQTQTKDMLYLEVLTNVPVAMELQGEFLYYYQNWTPGAPPASAFELPGGHKCPMSKNRILKKPTIAKISCQSKILV